MLESPVRLKKRPSPQTPNQPPQWHKSHKLIALVLLCSLGLGALRILIDRDPPQPPSRTDSALVNLRSLDPNARQPKLKSLIEQPRGLSEAKLKDSYRANYLLATDLVQQGKGKEALTYLQGLGKEYPLLRPQILFKIAQAHRLDNQPKRAAKTLNYLIDAYPQHPLSANALALLPESNRTSELFDRFPYHPITHNLARQSLRQKPDQFKLLLLLAKYGRHKNLNPIRDRLVLEYPAQLTADDWEAIADGYWRDEEHRKAADAYIYAPPVPRNLYRAARGFHRNGNLDTAKRAYQRLLREYHDSREAGQALVYLASISSGDEAVVYLEKAIAKFPANAPEAYRSKAIVHERFSKYESAKDSRKKLLENHGKSAAAAEYLWKKAKALAAKGDTKEAWSMMQPVVKLEREFDFGAKALYSTAKWAAEINKQQVANNTFEKVIRLYPQTYWAWRSAVMLGWDVGGFRSRSFSRT